MTLVYLVALIVGGLVQLHETEKMFGTVAIDDRDRRTVNHHQRTRSRLLAAVYALLCVIVASSAVFDFHLNLHDLQNPFAFGDFQQFRLTGALVMLGVWGVAYLGLANPVEPSGRIELMQDAAMQDIARMGEYLKRSIELGGLVSAEQLAASERDALARIPAPRHSEARSTEVARIQALSGNAAHALYVDPSSRGNVRTYV